MADRERWHPCRLRSSLQQADELQVGGRGSWLRAARDLPDPAPEAAPSSITCRHARPPRGRQRHACARVVDRVQDARVEGSHPQEAGSMNTRRMLEFGGVAAGVVLIAFGIGSLVLGLNARSTVRDEFEREFIRRLREHESDGYREGGAGGGSHQRVNPVLRRGGEGDQDGHRCPLLCRSTCASMHSSRRAATPDAQMGRFVSAA